MADALDYYPPAPASVPPDLTTPTSGYRLRVIVVLTSLFLFVLLYLGLVAGSAYVCYYAFFAPERASEPRAIIQGLFQQIGKVEQQVSKVYNDALEQSKRGMMDDARFLQVLERDLLPPWRAERQRLAGMEGLPPEEQRFVEQFSRYVQLREEGWELLSRAIRQNDLVLAEQGKGKSEEADRLATQISAEGARYASLSRPEKRESRGWLVIAGIASGLLCLFLMKGFFKWRRIDPSMRRVEVTEKRQPILFAFIRQLCRDTRAPFPHRVYLTADVNAAVFYHESFLSLFLPTPKNLVIGLGLVNHLNLSEFKAVLAHEFGHFSQRSMKLGSYVYMSNRIIGELVFGRDWVDDTVDSVRSLRGLSGAGVDVRVLMLAFVVAAFAWAFTGLLWGLRKALQGLFQVINFANSSLSRQMEFNADLVAVSVTGSDALIHGLARLDFAADSLSQAWIDLTAAADHQLFTRDFFYHQTRAADYLRALRKDPRLGEPPALPEDPQHVAQVFRPEDTSIPKMWATHPTNHDRETNAKRQYIRCPIDERSPWILFQEVPVVRETVTRQLYAGTQKLTQAELKAPEVVQAFIDQEHTETTYDLRYHGLYDRRHIVLPNIESLMQTAGEFGQDPGRLATAHVRLYGEELKARMAVHQTRQQEYALLAPLTHGHVELTGKDFLFRGARYRAAEAKRLLDQVQAELKEDFDWMGSLDSRTFLVHYGMACQLGEEVRRELEERYRFHLAVQEIHGQLSADNNHMQVTLSQLAGKRELTEAEFHGALYAFQLAYDSLHDRLEAARLLRLPALKNLTPGEPLAPFLLSRPLNHPDISLEAEWIGWFLEQLGEVLAKAQRIHFKSLGGILALQEGIAERWAALKAPVELSNVGPRR